MKDQYGRDIPDESPLRGDLQKILDEVGPTNYGKATASRFTGIELVNGVVKAPRRKYAVR
jgi:hypothetical protein